MARSQSTRPSKAPRRPGLFGVRTWTKTRLLIAVVFAAISMLPLFYMVSLSFQPTGLIGVDGATFVPTHPLVANYVSAWTKNSFGHFFFNSLLVSIATVALTVVFASLAAFAFARYKFPLKEVIFYLFLASLAVPSVELIIPQFLLMLRLHLVDSLAGLVLIYTTTNLPFSIFLLRGFFEGVPREYEESFRLDGAGTLRVLTRLIVPLSLPAVAVVAMFTFNFAWDEFVIALTLIHTTSHRTLPIGLALFIQSEGRTEWGPFMAASVIATVPLVIVYLLSQRWFRSGVSLGGIR
ncbi:MAG TPA: carbohydrate ABC transporter permease [Acidimicrobiales bacterium]|nr:carbohydrate ABC transporter permease [Acidimicrobiales bacterium]